MGKIKQFITKWWMIQRKIQEWNKNFLASKWKCKYKTTKHLEHIKSSSKKEVYSHNCLH